jgi:hypothetical protein
VVLALARADATVPVVEWIVGARTTELFLVRPNGGTGGGPRYFLRGLDLGRSLAELPFGAPAGELRRRALTALRRLGARPLREQTAAEDG